MRESAMLGRVSQCDVMQWSSCLLRGYFKDDISKLENDNGEKVIVRAETKVLVHASDFRVANSGTILDRSVYEVGGLKLFVLPCTRSNKVPK